jgi:invasion protein IalB
VSGRKRKKLTPRGRGSLLDALRRPYASWFAVLALLIQLAAIAARPADAQTQREQAAAALSAAIGQPAPLCDQGAGAPSGGSHPPSCCDDCPLCRLSHHAVAILPQRVAEIVVVARPERDHFVVIGDDAPTRRHFFDSARPRAPPALI